jgi:hypothetical protein
VAVVAVRLRCRWLEQHDVADRNPQDFLRHFLARLQGGFRTVGPGGVMPLTGMLLLGVITFIAMFAFVRACEGL